MIKKIIIYLMTCTFLFACDQSDKVKKAVKPAFTLKKSLQDNNVASTSGIDIKSGEISMFDSSSGKEITPCKGAPFIITTTEDNYSNIEQEKVKNANNNAPDCKVTIVNPSPELRQAVETKRSIIEGTVRKNGKDIAAKFFVEPTVRVLFPGSDCITEYRNGKQYQVLCVKDENNCPSIYYWSQLYASYYPNTVCPEGCTQEELDLKVIKQMNELHPECVDIIN